MAVPYDTLNAITEKYWGSDRIIDSVFCKTPLFDKLKSQIRYMGGTAIQFPVQYGKLSGGWRPKGGTMTLTTPEILTKGEMAWRYAYVPVSIWQEDIDINKNDPRKIASYLDAYINNAIDTMRTILASALFTAQSGNSLDSLVDAVNDSSPYAGLSTTDIPSWKAIIAEPNYSSTPVQPISPSISNVRKMIRAILNVCGEKPDLVITSPEVYDAIAKQADVFEKAIINTARNNDVIRLGYSAIVIDGVPIVDDLIMAEKLCTDFNSSGTSRSTCGGHQMLFLNTKYLFLYALPGRAMTWDSAGWVSNVDNTDYINKLHFWGNLVCVQRRAQGRIFGIDPTQSAASFTDMELDLSDFVPSV